MTKLPESAGAPGRIVVRRLLRSDAEAVGRAVAESLEHLRPWMAWIGDEPLDLEQRTAFLAARERDWADGGDVMMGVFADGVLVGGAGLHRRIGPEGLEIGYWIHVDHTRRGLATEAARLLVDAAFTVPGITRVEIHHDRANVASRGVPARLGFRLVEVVPATPAAPADEGIECRWRIERDEWEAGRCKSPA